MTLALWLVTLAALAASVLYLARREPAASLPLATPRRSLRRARAVLFALVALAALATAALVATTRTSAPGTEVLPTDSTAMVVLDLSDSTTRYFTQIAGTLDSLTRDPTRHLGLVVDSNTAYVALPPTTPVEGLRGWLHTFVRSPFLDYPWKGTFSQGAELSKGLVVARAALRRAHVANPHVVLVTDLSDDTFDLQRLAAVITQYQRERIDLRIVSLGEDQSAAAKADVPNWHNAAYIARAASGISAPLSKDGVATHAPGLTLVAILIALAALAVCGAERVPPARVEEHVRRALLLLGAALALAAGVSLLALAAAVHAVPHQLAREDAAVASADPGIAIGPRSVGERAARTLVGAPDRRPYLRALQLYTDATRSAGQTADPFGDVDAQQRDRGTGELDLGGVLASLHDPRERSQAATLLATLILLNSHNGKAAGGQQLVQQAAEHYIAAIRDDPRNDAAKLDLELLYRMHARSEQQQRPQQPNHPDPRARGGDHTRVTGNDY